MKFIPIKEKKMKERLKIILLILRVTFVTILSITIIPYKTQSCPSPDSQVMEQQEQIIQQNQWIIDFLNANIK